MAWIFGVVAVMACAGVVLWRRNAVRLTRRTGVAEARPAMIFRGGMRSRQGGGTRGDWARLEFFGDGIRLRGVGPLGPLLPLFEIRYDELIDAKLVASRFNSGVRFRASCLPDPVTFETCQSADIADLLEQRGVTVDRSVGHLGWLPGD